MKKISIYIMAIGLLFGCTDDLKNATDFTSVENPNLSESSIVGQPNSSLIWLAGLEREMALTLNEILILSELGSDNYVNTQTFFSQFLDNLEIRIDDPDMRDTQFRIARIRVAAQFGLNQVGPGDSEYTSATEAEYNFFEGMSYLYAGMYFSALPQEELGVPVSSADNLASAIASFETAIALNPQPEYWLALARANYYLGNQTEAVTAAQNAIALDNDFLRSAQYDQLNGPVNLFENALYQRGTFDDLQPLPTLDFLDPKYSFLTPDRDQSVHYLKAEEAYLILAESNLANSNLLAAQNNLQDLLSLIDTREVRNIDDSIEQRPDPSSVFDDRPSSPSVVVNGRAGLVLDRQSGNIDVPTVSGTSLTSADVTAMTLGDAALELLYRTRQEVFIAEGLRFADMGVKLVIHENEILQNPNVSEGDLGTVAVIPSFIDAVKNDLDAINFVPGSNTATTVINLTEILVANKNSDQVLPFH
ncbi:tetratricopeptide repeat protein [Aquimarina brevivitae]|uniref:Tetratricopeptide repeat protein n=1 Tax=Aquimarina brevivitae TaxID=323412 RepID=A0A4Q7PIC2_9FLAO|nr:hypothetical protein [Aquimarina brevivitae]RZT00364.1 hypothetical protein EV197_1600 [Aquimarina brevivitae]